MDRNKHLNIAVVGGNWDTKAGRPSSYVGKLAQALVLAGAEVRVWNGGPFGMLPHLLAGPTLAGHDAIIWMPNVPNDLPKQRGVKEAYPHKLLVSTKRNNGEYDFRELVNRALGQKANLCCDFKREGQVIASRIFDPLGVVWQDYTPHIGVLARVLVQRLHELRSFTRQGALCAGTTAMEIPNEQEFFSLVRAYADTLHELIMPTEGITRFLGNSSFRCERGFPSIREQGNNRIYVSRRNVDKRFIDPSAFVAVEFDGEKIRYWGPHKPSVDTPIQARLYRALPTVNFMLHAHAYLQGAPTTSRAISCGALEEVDEILSVVPDRDSNFICANLLGHGCIVMADDSARMRDLPLVARPMPEYLG